jgi:hypothetical protein
MYLKLIKKYHFVKVYLNKKLHLSTKVFNA